jgi:phosphoribosylformylglycinamidine synthase
MWQFAEATRGLADACRELDVPVVSGNVSLYNETDGKAVFPTPTVAVVGLLPDASKAIGMGFTREGDVIAVLGTTKGELGGSEWLHALHGKTLGRPPRLDAKAEKALQALVRQCIGEGLLSSAHDCAEGGLAVALAECCMAGQGARVKLDAGSVAPHAYLFGEDASRVVISMAPANVQAVAAACAARGVPFAAVGDVGGDALIIDGLLEVSVADASKAWRGGFPKAIGKA